MEVTTALRAHDCRYNKKHRIERGVCRLTIKSDGNKHHYFLACAKLFVTDSLTRLQSLSAEVGKTPNSGPEALARLDCLGGIRWE